MPLAATPQNNGVIDGAFEIVGRNFVGTFEEGGGTREVVSEVGDNAQRAQDFEVIGLFFEALFERIVVLLQVVFVGVLQMGAAAFLTASRQQASTGRQIKSEQLARRSGFGAIYKDGPTVLGTKSRIFGGGFAAAATD